MLDHPLAQQIISGVILLVLAGVGGGIVRLIGKLTGMESRLDVKRNDMEMRLTNRFERVADELSDMNKRVSRIEGHLWPGKTHD